VFTQAPRKNSQAVPFEDIDIFRPRGHARALLEKGIRANSRRTGEVRVRGEDTAQKAVRIADRYTKRCQFCAVEVPQVPRHQSAGRASDRRCRHVSVLGIGHGEQRLEPQVVGQPRPGQGIFHRPRGALQSLGSEIRAIALEGVQPLRFNLVGPMQSEQSLDRKRHEDVALILRIEDVRIDNARFRIDRVGSQVRRCPRRVRAMLLPARLPEPSI
jgi:hypothetical protein